MMHLRNTDQEHAAPETAASPRDRARRLLERWGGAPLLFFALLPDKRHLFGGADGREWGIAYRVVGRHALALGDPLGDPAAAPAAVSAFLDLCRRQGWRPAFYQVTGAHLDVYRAAGLRTVKVGEDAQIGLADFSLAGKRFKNLRNDLRRIQKAGVVLEVYGPDAPPPAEVVAEMAAISAGWRRAHRAKEGGFAMGAFAPDSDLFRESRFFVARDAQTSWMLAFTTFVPVFGAGETGGSGTRGWALDLMRRRPDALHGVMDLLIISAAQTFTEEGAGLMSLGLSPLAGADEQAEAAAVSHVRRFLFTRLGRVYNFQGLHTFKSKFATHWQPRYLVSRRGLGLAATAGAILKAHLVAADYPAPLPVRAVRSSRRRTMALAALLLLVFTPFEKTLAKRAAILPRRVAKTWGRHSPHWHSGRWDTRRWNHVLTHMGHVRRASAGVVKAPVG
jgi:phosphatidylglycerol lysyltransferase